MSQTGQPVQSSWRRRRSLIVIGVSVVLLTVILGGFLTYNQISSPSSQRYLTNTQNVVQTVTTNSIVTVLTTTLSNGLGQSNCAYYGCSYSPSNPAFGPANCGSDSCVSPVCGPDGCSFQICGPTGCQFENAGYPQLCGSTNCAPEICGFNGCYYTTCQSLSGNLLQCSGYLYQGSKGCTELEVPVANYLNGYMATTATQYYALHNLPSSTPPVGSWVTVTGQLNQGYNNAANGASCPGNYIVVSTMAP